MLQAGWKDQTHYLNSGIQDVCISCLFLRPSASPTDDIITRIRVDIQVRGPWTDVALGQQHRLALVKDSGTIYVTDHCSLAIRQMNSFLFVSWEQDTWNQNGGIQWATESKTHVYLGSQHIHLVNVLSTM